MRNEHYPGDGSEPTKIQEGVHIHYRPLLFYLGFDLILLGVLLGVPRLAGKPLWMSWLDITFSLLVVWALCICADAAINHGWVNRLLWRTACCALPVGLSLSLYYWYTRMDAWKGAGMGPEHIGSLVQMVLMIWVIIIFLPNVWRAGEPQRSESDITGSEEQ